MNERGQGFVEYTLMFVLVVVIVVCVIAFAIDMSTPNQSSFNDDILNVTEECMERNISTTVTSGFVIKSVNADGFLSCLYARDVTLSVRGDPVVMKVGE